MFYVHNPDKISIDLIFELIDKWSPSTKDLDIIRNDWEPIVKKIKEGKAHEISEGDTLYLGACTKAANSNVYTNQPYNEARAKPRAFALKSSYVKSIWQELLGIKTKAISKQTNTYEAVISKFKVFYGKNIQEIADTLSIDAEKFRKSKDFLSRFLIDVQKRLFGDKLVNLEEFQKYLKNNPNEKCNGCSQEFLNENNITLEEYSIMNESNTRCWNALDCENCVGISLANGKPDEFKETIIECNKLSQLTCWTKFISVLSISIFMLNSI